MCDTSYIFSISRAIKDLLKRLFRQVYQQDKCVGFFSAGPMSACCHVFSGLQGVGSESTIKINKKNTQNDHHGNTRNGLLLHI